MCEMTKIKVRLSVIGSYP